MSVIFACMVIAMNRITAFAKNFILVRSVMLTCAKVIHSRATSSGCVLVVSASVSLLTQV